MNTNSCNQEANITKLNEYVDKPRLDRSIKSACEIIGCRFADLEYNESDPNFANSQTYTKQANSNDISGYENKVRNKNALLLNSSAPDSRYFRDYYLDIGDGVIVHFNYSDNDAPKSKIVLMPLWSDVSMNTEDNFEDEYSYEGAEKLADSLHHDWDARTKPFTDNDLFVDFDEPLEEAAPGWREYELTYYFDRAPADIHTDIIAAKNGENDDAIIDRFMDSLFNIGYDEEADGTVEFIDIKPL